MKSFFFLQNSWYPLTSTDTVIHSLTRINEKSPRFSRVSLWTFLKLTLVEVMLLSLYLKVRCEGFHFGSLDEDMFMHMHASQRPFMVCFDGRYCIPPFLLYLFAFKTFTFKLWCETFKESPSL